MLEQQVAPFYLIVPVRTTMIPLRKGIARIKRGLSRVAHLVRVNVIGTSSMVGQNDDILAIYLDIATRNDDLHGTTAVRLAQMQADDTITKRADLGGMARPHPQLTRLRH